MSPALSDSPATLAITGTRLDGRDVDVMQFTLQRG